METILEWLPRIGALIVLLIGLVGLFKPRLFTDNMGIGLNKPEAYSEIRGVFGGLNIGTALAALILNQPLVYIALGMGWLFVLLARFYAIAVDGMTFRASIPAIIIDGGIAFLFLSGFLR